MATMAAATTRFFFPNVLFEPPSKFEAGFPREIRDGAVDERFKEAKRVWLVREGDLRPASGLHAPWLHAKLASQPASLQVSVPRQWILQKRHQLRRANTSTARAFGDRLGR
jgi:hypothetical protein